jgi:hypothetical protein
MGQGKGTRGAEKNKRQAAFALPRIPAQFASSRSPEAGERQVRPVSGLDRRSSGCAFPKLSFQWLWRAVRPGQLQPALMRFTVAGAVTELPKTLAHCFPVSLFVMRTAHEKSTSP